MKKLTWILAGAFVLTLASCKKKDKDNTDDPPTGGGSDVVVLQGTYSSDLTLDATKKYLLKGFVYVQSPAILTIPAGMIIKGDKGTKGTLIIERGAKIMAQGTSSNPIIFTSNQPAGSRSYGDWGGLIILGNAADNQPGSPIIEGGVDRPFGTSTTFASNSTADAHTGNSENSGVLSYVRIEFGGIAFTTDNEINGLTLGSVGSGTQIDHVQVSYAGDDAFEWFGGTVNCSNLVSFRNLDDDFDTDFGFSGNVQYGVVVRDPNVSDQGPGGSSNGFESDGDAAGAAVFPHTRAKFANITVYGPMATSTSTLTTGGSTYRRAAHIRRNSSISIYNSVLMGYPIGLLVDNTGTSPVTGNVGDNSATGAVFFRGNVIAGTAPQTSVSTAADTLKYTQNSAAMTKPQLDTWFNAGSNTIYAENTSLGLPMTQGNTSLFTAPNFIPNGGSVLLSGGVTLPAGLTATTYRGAFNATDWTSGWANWDPQNADYGAAY